MKHIKRIGFLIGIIAAAVSCTCADEYTVKVEKIWGDGDTYCAFTSLIEHGGRYYCTFREGESHVFDSKGNAEGKIRVITSKNGRKWKSFSLSSKEGYDLRDPKICVMPDGSLMLIMGGSVYRNRQLIESHPQVCFCTDGKTFSEPQPAVFEDDFDHVYDWLWDIKWHDGVGYSVNYGREDGGEENRKLRLYSTTDGIHFKFLHDLAGDIGTVDFPNETAVEFLPDGRMALMVRCDANNCNGWWATAEAPFTNWTWKRMQYELGGPDFIPYNGGIIASSRLYLPAKKTAVFIGSDDGWIFPEILLPSDGDTSYPGLLLKDKELWLSYYSTHKSPHSKSRASIYLAKIPLKLLDKLAPVTD